MNWIKMGGLEVSQFPVTVAEYSQFVSAGGYDDSWYWSPRGWSARMAEGWKHPCYWGEDGYSGFNYPVTGISFWEAEAFGSFLGARLPSVDEWQWIATNRNCTRFPWGDEPYSEHSRRANFSFFGVLGEKGLTAVNYFALGASKDGVLDLLGNVSEWCNDSMHSGLDYAALCGGCWWHTPLSSVTEQPDWTFKRTRDNQTGIRLVRGPELTVSSGRKGDKGQPPSRSFQRPTKPFRQEGIAAPSIDEWRLSVGLPGGRIENLSYASIKEDFPRTTCRGLFVCVCRWGQMNEISGVCLRDLFSGLGVDVAKLAGMYLDQKSVVGPSGKSYESCIALDATCLNDVLVCHELDGQTLTPELGWPVRLMSFRLYGYKLVKCLRSLSVVSEFRPGWWEKQCGYDPVGRIQAGSITLVGENACRLEIGTVD